MNVTSFWQWFQRFVNVTRPRRWRQNVCAIEEIGRACRPAARTMNKSHLFEFFFIVGYFVRPRVADTADSDTVVTTPSGEDDGRSSEDDSETEPTRDVRPEGVESSAGFRDCLGLNFIANNRLDVVANLLTSPTYVMYHCRVNLRYLSPLESRP